LIARGWQVADMEIVRWVWTPKGRVPVKRDQFGADLLAMDASRIVFVQVKGGLQAIGGGQFPAARRAFEAFKFPPDVGLWLMAWAPRAREPRILVLKQERPHGEEEGRSAQAHPQAQGHDDREDPDTHGPQRPAPRHGASAKRAPRSLVRGHRR
jgi:hypothetical protein